MSVSEFQRKPSPRGVARYASRLLAGHDPQRALGAISWGLERWPDDMQLKTASVVAKAACGQIRQANTDLMALMGEHENPPWLYGGIITTLELGGYSGQALDLLTPLFRQRNWTVMGLQLLAMVTRARTHRRRTQRILQLLLNNAPAEATGRVIEFCLHTGRLDVALEVARRQLSQPSGQRQLHGALLLEQLGEGQEARAAAETQLAALDPASKEEWAGRLRRAAGRMARTEPLQRWRGSADVLFRRREGATNTLVVFTGMHPRLQVPTTALDRWFGKLNANVVYLYDPLGLYFVGGLHGLGGSFESTADSLKELHEELGGRLLMFGYSAGGYAAIRYGLMLGAERVLTLATLTDLTDDLYLRSMSGRILDRRMRLFIPEQRINLRRLMEEADPPLRLVNYYGGANQNDRRQADNVGDLPKVTTVPLEGVETHFVVHWLDSREQLDAMLEELVDGGFSERAMQKLGKEAEQRPDKVAKTGNLGI